MMTERGSCLVLHLVVWLGSLWVCQPDGSWQKACASANRRSRKERRYVVPRPPGGEPSEPEGLGKGQTGHNYSYDGARVCIRGEEESQEKRNLRRGGISGEEEPQERRNLRRGGTEARGGLPQGRLPGISGVKTFRGHHGWHRRGSSLEERAAAGRGFRRYVQYEQKVSVAGRSKDTEVHWRRRESFSEVSDGSGHGWYCGRIWY